MSSERNLARKFIFEAADIRGEIVHLDSAYRDILAIHQYPGPVARLLGEFLAASVLLSTTIKFEGRLVLQAQGGADLSLLMAECSNELEIRGIARGADTATGEDFTALLGGGHLAITIEPADGQRYQGIVSLEGGSLAGCIESYFENSEQLPTRLWLAGRGAAAAAAPEAGYPGRAGAGSAVGARLHPGGNRGERGSPAVVTGRRAVPPVSRGPGATVRRHGCALRLQLFP